MRQLHIQTRVFVIESAGDSGVGLSDQFGLAWCKSGVTAVVRSYDLDLVDAEVISAGRLL
jgi:hypothetical protein